MSAGRPLSRRGAVLRHLALAPIALFALAPFLWMLLTSIKPPEEIFLDTIRLWPQHFYGLENYAAAFTKAPLGRFLLNGAVVTASIFLLQAAVALPAAYALAKLRFRGRETVFALVLLCLLIPPQAVAVPLFLLFFQLGILNSYAALIVPFTISVFGIFLMRQFFRTVPDDLVDAARIDGISEFGIVWRVMLPTALPALTAFGIFSVVAHWNDYFWPLIAVNAEHLYTPPLGVVAFRNEEAGTSYGPLMAAAAIIILPLVLLFLFAQRRFIEGITFTGMK
ncbi:carbohydrate ABC transporter membrane protein 2, CUT1 family [Tistlia consotensis]|uniref:Carbohydrate ABC transporter membrane protein 2, CUT1 family n=1 Tax=Tistlia consotensis USBA 355 TaxID=560819 RepID=A0A1Y6BEF3_9PROT|nr:carbohydrate ABC transporter permease [Tistlia consotensis]SMF00495.1 carbohydrate ABC transporter membrane protein 2, CUT1 family [Tistlia consotensis USBA 355]SNR75781.1 carbohydrate ABC transporter membrane protein 2, CUT1 family [Tistlia consotensis]